MLSPVFFVPLLGAAGKLLQTWHFRFLTPGNLHEIAPQRAVFWQGPPVVLSLAPLHLPMNDAHVEVHPYLLTFDAVLLAVECDLLHGSYPHPA